MKLRKFTSLTTLVSFLVIAGTGIILFLVPQGRIAAWAGWHLAGLERETWVGIHILISLLFLTASIVHIVLNWSPIVTYLRDHRQRLTGATAETATALGLVAAFVLGAALEVPPFVWLLDLNQAVKDRAAVKFGEPPYGHAELSPLARFARQTGLDAEKTAQALRDAGIRVSGLNQSLLDIAHANRTTPQRLAEIAKGTASATAPGGAGPMPGTAGTTPDMPADTPPGTGRLTLQALCNQYRLDADAIAAALTGRGRKVDAAVTMRANAEANGIGPHDLYAVIREVATHR